MKIVSIGSSSYNQPRKNYILYTAAKTALNNIQASAKELFIRTKINFYVINPPAMKSRMRSKILKLLNIKKKIKAPENLAKIAKQIIKKIKI